MTDWRRGDDEDEAGGDESLADTEAETTEEQRSGESLADTEAEVTLMQEGRRGEDS